MITLLEGILLGLAYVMPIGAQNMYVIHSSINNNIFNSYKISSFVIIMDISLAMACYFGIGILVSSMPSLANILQLIGAIYLLKISINLFKEKVKLNMDKPSINNLTNLRSAFILTWMNPQALIDGSILLGSFKNKHSEDSTLFIIGVCLASISWFYSITTVIRIFHKKINETTLKIINILCASALSYLGISLLFNLIQKVNIL